MTAPSSKPGTQAPHATTGQTPAETLKGAHTVDRTGPRLSAIPMWGNLPTALRRGLLFLALIGLWQAYVSLANVNPLVFSSPWTVAQALYTGLASGEIATATVATLKILLIGMAIGTAAATVLTTLAVWTKFGDDLLVLLSSMINPLPSIAILPLAILWFGLSPQALIFVVANAITWPIAINLSIGFRTVNPTVLAVGRNIGLSRTRQITEVLMPAALPHTIAGLKTAWAFGWRTIIAAELVFGVAGGEGGLGWFINNSRYFLKIPQVFAGLVTIALIGILIDMVFTLIERQTVVKWGMKS